MIEFECPHCGNVLRVEPAHAGRHAWCRRCKRVAIVPSRTEGVEPAGEAHGWSADAAGTSSTTSFAAAQEVAASGAESTDFPPSPSPEEVEELRAQLDQQTRRLEDVATELDAVRSQRETLRGELERAREELELAARRAAEALDERQRLESATQSALDLELDGRIAALTDAQEEARQARQDAERLRQVIEESRERMRGLEEHVRLLEHEREAALQIRAERDSLQDRSAELESSLRSQEAALSDLQSRYDGSVEDTARAEAALEVLRQREASYVRETEQLQHRLIELQDAAEAAKSAAGTADALAAGRESELLELRRELETLRTAHAALVSSAKESGPALADLEARLAQCNEDIRGLERDAEEALVLARDREQECVQLRADLSSAKAAAEEAAQEAARLRGELDEANAALESLREESMERDRAGVPVDDDDPSIPNIESEDSLATDVAAHKVDEDQTMLVDALLRFLGRK